MGRLSVQWRASAAHSFVFKGQMEGGTHVFAFVMNGSSIRADFLETHTYMQTGYSQEFFSSLPAMGWAAPLPQTHGRAATVCLFDCPGDQ
mmetsp:Transcript_40413/g.101130  ORF Transcript_40413/g.101130 Transcript_40413/m.101130 type:complete len:90 (-) Transcript_40413:670-939(-)